MNTKISALIILILIFCAVPGFAKSVENEKAAAISAEVWLRILDDGKYAESWKQAAELFKNAVTQQQWEQSLEAVRRPLGKVLTRKVKTNTYTTSLPGASDGEYVVIEFVTSFENKKTATETVTPMKDRDGKWRVSGYYIR